MAKKEQDEKPDVTIPKCPTCKKILLICKCEKDDLVKSMNWVHLYWDV